MRGRWHSSTGQQPRLEKGTRQQLATPGGSVGCQMLIQAGARLFTRPAEPLEASVNSRPVAWQLRRVLLACGLDDPAATDDLLSL